ncbi:MAG: hypothetical protein CMJ46_16170 [Planctomyces sp.]|nr:hypothetical protein [Planctomyces sp.]
MTTPYGMAVLNALDKLGFTGVDDEIDGEVVPGGDVFFEVTAAQAEALKGKRFAVSATGEINLE